MAKNRMNTYRLPAVSSAVLGLLTAGLLPAVGSAADTVTTSDYIYIAVEAETAQNVDERWVLTEPGTPAQENDPDGNHSDLAAGNAYLELLPDVRVTHEDPMGPPTAYWGTPGTGPSADFPVEIPEPGRYYVHVRAYSTGTEDNGIHIGADGNWPASGARMQFCTAARRAWSWSSAQRDAGGMGSCGMEKTIWLDFETAGSHTVSISAREDGFEIDRLVLIKDLSGNTRICSPTGIDEVSCKNGSIESADGFVDLRTTMTLEPASLLAGEEAVLTVAVENLDAFDTATGVELTLTPAAGVSVLSADTDCTAVNDTQVCTLASLEPTAPNENHPFVFTVTGTLDGALPIGAVATANEADSGPANDSASTTLTVEVPMQPTDLGLQLSLDASTVTTGETVTATFVAANTGAATALQATLDVTLPEDVQVENPPANCSGTGPLSCELDEIDTGADATLTLSLVPSVSGAFSVSGVVSASNDSVTDNNSASAGLVVADPVVVEPDDGDTGDGNGAADGSSGESDGDPETTPAQASVDPDAGAPGLVLLLLLGVWSVRRYRWGV